MWQLLNRLFACMPLAVLIVAPGCARKPPAAPETKPPTVSVSTPIAREVTDYVDFTGRTDAVFSTDIRPRVTGYLTGMPFKEGTQVKKDEVLFEIDDRPYKAALDQAKGDLERQKAALVKAQANYDVGLSVQKQNPAAISVQELNTRLGSRDEAAGAVKVAEANLENATLNYNWCKVRSPITGRVSRYDLTLGNLVNQDSTLLTTVVSEDPIYVYFDVDENTLLYVMRNIILPSKIDIMKEKGGIPVLMGLADEQGFPHQGDINFANNIVNPSTGTITLRGVFANPANPFGKRLLWPGMFVRIRLPIGKPHPALLVSEKAMGSDQGQRFLLTVNDKNLVESQRVVTGPLQDDGLRVIDKGLKAGQRVIVSGLQLVRSGMEVKTEVVPMPGTSPSSESGGKSEKPAAVKPEADQKDKDKATPKQ